MRADGLLARMFAASALQTAMLDLIRSLRRAGLRTALLSNSWGNDDYPRHLFPELFDVVVISSEVGMRKPEERIFRHAAALLGLAPQDACSSTTSRPTWPRRKPSAWSACTTASRAHDRSGCPTCSALPLPDRNAVRPGGLALP